MNQLIRKHSVLICAAISVILIVIAAFVYPGGSFIDKNSVGFDWTKNFFSNLFASKAMNGLENASRIWAIMGMAFHSVAYGIFFTHMSKKIPSRHTKTVLKVIGVANIVFSFLIVTPLHDIMVTISGTLTLIGMFYITVFILMTKLHVFKVCCILYMLTFYFTMYLYGAGHLGLLAIMQKVTLVSSMLLILALEYFTKQADFIHIKSDRQKMPATNR